MSFGAGVLKRRRVAAGPLDMDPDTDLAQPVLAAGQAPPADLAPPVLAAAQAPPAVPQPLAAHPPNTARGELSTCPVDGALTWPNERAAGGGVRRTPAREIKNPGSDFVV